MARWTSGWHLPHYSPLWLPFAPPPWDFRQWATSIDQSIDKLPQPIRHGMLRASVHRILVEAGIALTCAESLFDPASWFALYRYRDTFARRRPELWLQDNVKSMDDRLKAVLSEEAAVGIACYVLREHLDVVHIADMKPMIDRGYVGYASGHADLKRGDFYCLDNASKLVFSEAKGTSGPGRRFTKTMNGACKQIKNLVPLKGSMRSACDRVAIGTWFRFEGDSAPADTTTYLNDPDGPVYSQEPIDDFPIRTAYAKVLRYAGQGIGADYLLAEEPVRISRPRSLNVKGTTLVPLGISPLGDTVLLLREVFEAVVESRGERLIDRLGQALSGFSASSLGEPQEDMIVLSNGVVIDPSA